MKAQSVNLSDLPPWLSELITALLDGFLAPLYELILGVMIYAGISIVGLVPTASTINAILTIVIFFIIIVLVNLLATFLKGFDNTQYAVLYVIGAIIGIIVFGGVISKADPTATLFVGLYIILSLVGIGARVYAEYRKGQNSNKYAW